MENLETLVVKQQETIQMITQILDLHRRAIEGLYSDGFPEEFHPSHPS